MKHAKRFLALPFLIIFLAACGTYSELPEQVAEADVEEIVAVAELAPDAEIGSQGYKRDNLVLRVEKQVLPDDHADPHPAKYDIDLICKKKGGGKLVIDLPTFTKSGAKTYNVSKSKINYYLGNTKHCFVRERGTVGTKLVRFNVTKDAKTVSGFPQTVLPKDYANKRTVKSKKFDLEHVNKKIVIKVVNKFEEEKKEEKDFELVVEKKFVDAHGNEVKPEHYYLSVDLECKEGKKDVIDETLLTAGKLHFSDHDFKDLGGLKCEIEEKFASDDLKLHEVIVKFEASEHGRHIASGEKKDKHIEDKHYKGKEVQWANSGYFHVPEKADKLVIIIIDVVKEVEDDFELVVEKKFVDAHGNPVDVKDYYLEVDLECKEGKKDVVDETLLTAGKLHFSDHDFKDLGGLKCEIEEKFASDDLKLHEVIVKFEASEHGRHIASGEKKDKHIEDKHYKGKEVQWANSGYFHVPEKADKLVIIIIDVVKEVEDDFKIIVNKEFKEGNYNGHVLHLDPHAYDLRVAIVCEDGTRVHVNLGNDLHFSDHDAEDLRGKKCYVEEYFKSDYYDLLRFRTTYSTDNHDDYRVSAGVWKSEKNGYQYVNNDDKPFHISKDADELVIDLVNAVEESKYYH